MKRRRACPKASVISILAFLLVSASPRAGEGVPFSGLPEASLARADSLALSGQPAAALRILDSLDASAIGREDTRLQWAAQLGRTRVLLATSRFDDAERVLRPLLASFRSSRDTLLWVRGMRVEARLQALRQRIEPAARAYRASIRTARAAGLALEEARSEMAASHDLIDQGRNAEATEGSRRAMSLLEPDGDERTRMWARAGLARALTADGKAEEARRQHALVLEIAARAGDRAQLAESNFNMGSLEHVSGDISKAEAFYLRALDLYRAVGWRDRQLTTANALAILRLNGRRGDEADSILTMALPIALGPGVSSSVRARVVCQMGVLRRVQERFDEAIDYGRRAVAASDSIPVQTALEITWPLLSTLGRAGRPADALEVVKAQLLRLGPRMTPVQRTGLLLQNALIARRVGRPREGLGPLIAAAPARGSLRGSFAYDGLTIMSEVARCYEALGLRDSSILWYRRTADEWESWRRESRDPLWRERYDEAGQRFAGEYAAALLDARRGGSDAQRANDSFAALQRFRARTLIERMHDPTRGPVKTPRPVSVAGLRRTALRPGDVFIDIHATPETTLVIAVTTDSILAWGAPRSKALHSRLALLRELMSKPSRQPAALRDQASAALGRDLFGPGAHLIADSKVVFLSAGSLGQYPLGMLTVPGARSPLVLAAECSLVPSATLLAEARKRHGTGAGARLVAIARTADGQGRQLRGARDEAQWLARSFAGAEARVDDDRVSRSTVAGLTARAAVIHWASHARDGASRPWQSALLLGRPGTPDAWLQASDVARMRSSARLYVFASCGSIGGGGDFGETLEGLATACLAAGVPTAIATQWEVDDASASVLMRRFYEVLARGESVGRALREAQNHVRNLAGTSDPCYWAGYVTLGNPDTRIPLRRR